jgi:hypothetical protein
MPKTKPIPLNDHTVEHLAAALTGLMLTIYEVDELGEIIPEDHPAMAAAREALEEVE